MRKACLLVLLFLIFIPTLSAQSGDQNLLPLPDAHPDAVILFPGARLFGNINSDEERDEYLLYAQKGDEFSLTVQRTEGTLFTSVLLAVPGDGSIIGTTAVDSSPSGDTAVLKYDIERSGWYLIYIGMDNLALPTQGSYMIWIEGISTESYKLLPTGAPPNPLDDGVILMGSGKLVLTQPIPPLIFPMQPGESVALQLAGTDNAKIYLTSLGARWESPGYYRADMNPYYVNFGVFVPVWKVLKIESETGGTFSLEFTRYNRTQKRITGYHMDDAIISADFE